jgi:dienelactone hydrolase
MLVWSRIGRGGAALVMLVAALVAPQAAWAQQKSEPASKTTELVAGYEALPAIGPERAKGAIIWNHGLARLAEAAGETPFFVDHLQRAGWDVFRLQRRWASDRPEDSSNALIAEARELKAQGYKKIVTAGQSFGAWISLIAAGKTKNLFDAVIGTAPAAHGEIGVSSAWRLNADKLYDIAASMNPSRTLLFLFEKDPFDPGDRAPKLRQIFSDRGVPNAIVDRPKGFTGHGVGQTSAFAHVYGPCVVAFVEAAAIARDFSCDRYIPAKRGTGFSLPASVKIVPAPAEAPQALAKMLGWWYGWYDSGRQVLLIVEEVGRDRALAYYATSAQFRRAGDRGTTTRRRGEFDAATATLRFSEKDRTPLEYKLRPDGQLDATWTSVDGKSSLTTTLRRVD